MKTPTSAIRAVAAAALALIAVLLLWPTTPQQPPRCWLDLIAPLEPGGLIAGDYRLSPPRRGEEHDIVFVARRLDGQAVAELHVVARGQWKGAHQTASFGVDFEQPRSSGPKADLARVTIALTKAIAANDPGGLGPVDAIALTRSAPPPKLTTALRKATGIVGVAIAICLLAASLLLGSFRRGALWLGIVTFAAGLALRLAHLDLPFLWDQDVQRLQIGASNLSEILAGVGLQDRRPPLLFVVLHFAQLFGQAEWIVRLPAALAGAALGPAILWSTHKVAGRISPLSSIATTLAALSPILIAHSRQVSELTMFALLLIVLVGLAAHITDNAPIKRSDLIATTTVCALAFWLSYLAALAILPGFAVAAIYRRVERKQLERKRLIAIAAGLLAGLPSLLLGAQMLIRDLPTRDAARASPTLAWGNRGVVELLAAQWQLLSEAVGAGVVLLAAAGCAWALAKKQALVVVAFTMVVSVAVTIAALAPLVRVQPYYLVAVIPLLLLALSALQLEGRGAHVAWISAAIAAVWFLSAVPSGLANLYLRGGGAFMCDFANQIQQDNSRRVATVTDYDATLLSYYLARNEGVRLRADRLRWTEGELVVEGLAERIVSLVRTHASNQQPDSIALGRLRAEVSRGPILLVSRHETRLPALDLHLARCEIRSEAAAARLLLCRQQDLVP